MIIFILDKEYTKLYEFCVVEQLQFTSLNHKIILL